MRPRPLARQHRYITWLSLSLMSFLALMVLIVYESRWVYPEIQAYFSQTGNLTGQQLATRSRAYLQDAQSELLIDQPAQAALDAAIINIELAYGLFDVHVYRRQYECTEPGLVSLNRVLAGLALREFDRVAVVDELFAPIQCLTHIEMHQLDQRGAAINNFSESTRQHNQVLTYSSLLIFVMGLVFWWLHERQLRRTDRATQDTFEWMQRAMRDPLTGVGNRSALHQDVLAKQHQSLGLILVDIDYFKQYNDAYGHPQGDTLLRQLATLIGKTLNDEAQLYRLGGDEFAALIFCPDTETLKSYCRQLIEGVRKANFAHPAHSDKKDVTLSVGGSCFVADEATFPYAYEAADKALYRVKTAGRDGWQVTEGA
ncbi:GGDEF domain-containing protein [Vreelandella boliviensis]|uniref:diguanylate cyclase n=2 Tax=Vreelandella boliviensis LC1 TaxID=1072583 RepID=A0ABX4GCB1_9GAMM|nr:GGDEF domain-containing protein [Halomonas boliviensis]OZT75003.1 GGDEF domain-containing protein [Halomonas boliviensis LC1]